MLSIESRRLPRAYYAVDVHWRHIELTLEEWADVYGLDIDPPFQRAHVWTEAQQRAYMEALILGADVNKTLTFNCPGWNRRTTGKDMVLVDGKQRLAAVRKFWLDGLRLFPDDANPDGYLRGEIDPLDLSGLTMVFRVAALPPEKVLWLYLGMNTGGTPHTEEEIAKVKAMMQQVKA